MEKELSGASAGLQGLSRAGYLSWDLSPGKSLPLPWSLPQGQRAQASVWTQE